LSSLPLLSGGNPAAGVDLYLRGHAAGERRRWSLAEEGEKLIWVESHAIWVHAHVTVWPGYTGVAKLVDFAFRRDC
jgi:hypothetical protein